MKSRTEDDDDIVQDGQRVSVPLMLMDSVQQAIAATGAGTARNKPGFVAADSANVEARQALYDAADRKLSEAWKNPAPLPASSVDDHKPAAKPPAAAATDLAALYDTADKRLCERWRGAA